MVSWHDHSQPQLHVMRTVALARRAPIPSRRARSRSRRRCSRWGWATAGGIVGVPRRSAPPSSRWAGSTTGWTRTGTGRPGGPTSRSPPARSTAVRSAVAGLSRRWPSRCWACHSARPRRSASRWSGIFALLYDWPLKSTPFSVLPYLVAFGLLPAFVVVALPGHPAPPVWLVAAGALLGGGRALRQRAARPGRRRRDRGARPAAPARRRRLPGRRRGAAAGRDRSRWSSDRAGPPSWAGIAAAAVAAVVLPLGWYAGARRPPAVPAGRDVPRGHRGGPDRRPAARLQRPGGVTARRAARCCGSIVHGGSRPTTLDAACRRGLAASYAIARRSDVMRSMLGPAAPVLLAGLAVAASRESAAAGLRLRPDLVRRPPRCRRSTASTPT